MNRFSPRTPRPPVRRRSPVTSRGFTLIELLIVIAIMMILTGMVVVVFNASASADRIRAAARQTQSAFMGARDRAIKFKSPRGLRLMLDPNTANDQTVVIGFQYIQSSDNITGKLYVGRPDTNNDGGADDNNNSTNDGTEDVIRTIRGDGNTNWYSLAQRGMIINGSRIQIPANTGRWYTLDLSRLDATHEIMGLTTDYAVTPVQTWPMRDAFADAIDYTIELQPTLSPGEEPISLPSGIVIDLDNSWGPSYWKWAGNYSLHMDVLFSPRGAVHGPLAAQGLLHFLLAEQRDTDPALNLPPANRKGEQLLVTLFPQAGTISTHPVYLLGPDGAPGVAGVDDDSKNGIDDAGEIGYASSDDGNDLYRYAKAGAIAGK